MDLLVGLLAPLDRTYDITPSGSGGNTRHSTGYRAYSVREDSKERVRLWAKGLVSIRLGMYI